MEVVPQTMETGQSFVTSAADMVSKSVQMEKSKCEKCVDSVSNKGVADTRIILYIIAAVDARASTTVG